MKSKHVHKYVKQDYVICEVSVTHSLIRLRQIDSVNRRTEVDGQLRVIQYVHFHKLLFSDAIIPLSQK